MSDMYQTDISYLYRNSWVREQRLSVYKVAMVTYLIMKKNLFTLFSRKASSLFKINNLNKRIKMMTIKTKLILSKWCLKAFPYLVPVIWKCRWWTFPRKFIYIFLYWYLDNHSIFEKSIRCTHGDDKKYWVTFIHKSIVKQHVLSNKQNCHIGI